MKLFNTSASTGGLLTLLCALSHVKAQVPPSQNVSLTIGSQTTCNASCQAIVQAGYTFERQSHSHAFLDDFYDVPAIFNTSVTPGTILKLEEHTNLVNYSVPSGLSLSRIMYASQSLNGTAVPASAFVLWPYAAFAYTSKCGNSSAYNTAASKGKFPIVAWAHGTAGQYAECAPSNYRALQYHFMTSFPLALEGFAVVATDYAGLGAHGSEHNWLAGPAAANDIAFAIQAARTAFPSQFESDGPFVTLGHSQGGNAAWAFAERQAKTPVPGYCGTTTISPPLRPVDWVNKGLQKLASLPDPTTAPLWAQVVFSLQPKIIAAITSIYPAYNASGMTNTAWDRWYNVIKPLRACLSTEDLALYDLQATSVKPNWTSESTPNNWQAQVGLGGKPVAGPMLVIAGDNDFIPLDMISEDVNKTCAVAENEGASMEVAFYQAAEHFSVIQTSRPRWMGWIKERVTGGTVDAGCGNYTMAKSFNGNFTVHSAAPNWLVEWASMQEQYKYVL